QPAHAFLLYQTILDIFGSRLPTCLLTFYHLGPPAFLDLCYRHDCCNIATFCIGISSVYRQKASKGTKTNTYKKNKTTFCLCTLRLLHEDRSSVCIGISCYSRYGLYCA